MSGGLLSRYSSMAMAGAIAWAAVGLELWRGPIAATAIGMTLPVHGLARGLHVLFALVFVASLARRLPRRVRLIMATVQCVITLVLVALYRYNSAAALLIIPMLQFASLLGWRALACVYLLTNGLLLGVVLAYRGMDAPLTYVGLHASLQLFAMLLVSSARKVEQARDQLAEVNAELIAARGILAEVSRAQERLRLSRELHDVAGHRLTALRLNLGALIHNKQLETAPTLALCASLTEALLDDLRSVVHQLRLHDGLELAATMQRIAEPFPRPKVALQIDADARVDTPEQAEALLRTFQEGLTNAARHSDAGCLWASLRREGHDVVLDMRDDGSGRGLVQAGHGLTGMHERLTLLGGSLTYGAPPEGGFRLQARLPL